MRKARRSIVHGPPEFKTRWADWHRERQKFYSLLNQLKRDGLVLKKKQGKYSRWSITQKGMNHFIRIKNKPRGFGILPKRHYAQKEAATLVIVSFDIPERERKKRDWLRENLMTLGFKMLQRSVWFGKVQIPENFIHDLKDNGILSYVHIFSVSKGGSVAEDF